MPSPILSLRPRFDLFHFQFPKTFFPDYIIEKYNNAMKHNQSVFVSSVDYVNESIIGVTIPGISELITQQNQISHNQINVHDKKFGLGKINIEPHHQNKYKSHDNILSHIDNTFTVKMRKNQGLYNYFMMYETILYHYDKRNENDDNTYDLFEIDILNEVGCVTCSIHLYQPIVNGIEGMEFSYNKIERQGEEFLIEFQFNNIDFKFLPS